MRPIHVVMIDKPRPALILTRPTARQFLTKISVAPITSTIRGISTEVAVGRLNGLDHDSVVNCDNIQTVHVDQIGRQVGALQDSQEAALSTAIRAAYGLA
jgi:mRNA interferase MazF